MIEAEKHMIEAEKIARQMVERAEELCEDKSGWEYAGCLEEFLEHPCELLETEEECLQMPRLVEVVFRNIMIEKIASVYNALYGIHN